MKNVIRTLFLFLSVSFLLVSASQAASGILLPTAQTTEKPAAEKPAKLAYSPKLTKLEVENFLGRKMTFMERVGFKLNKKKFVKTTNEVNAMADSDSTNTMAIVGFVSSLVLAPLGIVFSAIALGQIKKTGQKGRGFAIAGLVIGIVFTAIGLISLL